jgi:predicted alpha/beta-fold hydrolase
MSEPSDINMPQDAKNLADEEEEKWQTCDEQDEAFNEEKDEEAYRLRVYGKTGSVGEPRRRESRRPLGSFRKFSKQLSSQLSVRRSSVIEALPETPAGWTVLLSALLSMGLGYEVQLQKSLTKPPITLGQLPDGSVIASVHDKMTATADSILSRKIQPSLFVGTRGAISTAAAYLFGGPSSTEEHLRFREIVTSSRDGAKFGVDWEVPWKTDDPSISNMPADDRKAEILKGPIRQPVAIILHGINNDASFGYMRSLQRTFANRGWNAAAMNFRGCGGVPLATPRGYNASYTGDIRNLVLQISGRLAENVPVFLVGNSMGANLLTKYLGEEGLSGTLPTCVAGAVSLGNPMIFDTEHIAFPFNVVMGQARKQNYIEHYRALSKMRDPQSREALRKVLCSTTLAGVDRAVSTTTVRNDSFYPFAPRVGYKDASAYWQDSSSYRLSRFISVPFLHLTAEDDFLVYGSSKNKLAFSASNPNIMVVETRCGGHLGWQESPPESDSVLSFGASSWADVASADFFESVMQVNTERSGSPTGTNLEGDAQAGSIDLGFDFEKMKEDAFVSTKELRSRL